MKLGGYAFVENCIFEGRAWEINILEKKATLLNSGKTAVEYHQGKGLTVVRSTLQNLNCGIVMYGSPTTGTTTNTIRKTPLPTTSKT